MKFIELFKKDGITPNWRKIFNIPEFKAMKKTKQSKKWHGEGNVDVHTKLVTQHMIEYFESRKKLHLSYDNWYYTMMVSAAICHDLGKPSTTQFDTEKNDWSCKNHGDVGSKIVRRLFYDEEPIMRERVCYMVRHHMALHHVLDDTSKTGAKLRKLSNGLVPVRDMLILKSCDEDGTLCEENNQVACYEKNTTISNLCKPQNKESFFTQPYAYETSVDKILDCALNDTKHMVGNVVNPFTIYVMIGLPGSGKDTYIKDNLKNLPVVCRDDIRSKIGIKGIKPMGNKMQENQVTEISNKLIDKLCNERQSFVFNNTNIVKKYRIDFLKRVIRHNPKIIYVYVEAPSLEDNKQRRKGMIAPSIIESMLNRFDFPDYTECDEIIFSIQKKDKQCVKQTYLGIMLNKIKRLFKKKTRKKH